MSTSVTPLVYSPRHLHLCRQLSWAFDEANLLPWKVQCPLSCPAHSSSCLVLGINGISAMGRSTQVISKYFWWPLSVNTSLEKAGSIGNSAQKQHNNNYDFSSGFLIYLLSHAYIFKCYMLPFRNRLLVVWSTHKTAGKWQCQLICWQICCLNINRMLSKCWLLHWDPFRAPSSEVLSISRHRNCPGRCRVGRVS